MWTTLAEWSTYANAAVANVGYHPSLELGAVTQLPVSDITGVFGWGLGALCFLRWELFIAETATTTAVYPTLRVRALTYALFGQPAAVEARRAVTDLAAFAVVAQQAMRWDVGADLLAQQLSAWTTVQPLGLFFFVFADWTLLLAELILFIALAARVTRLIAPSRLAGAFYDDLVTFCQQNGLSLVELAVVLSLSLALLSFDLFFAFGEEDLADVVSYGILIFVVVTGFGLFLALDVLYYFMVSGVGSSSATLRVVATDVVNNGLCLLRVFFCWTRYIFYDLQTELVDFTLQYTDLANEAACGALVAGASAEWSTSLGDRGTQTLWLGGLAAAWALVGAFLDLALMVAQALISFFKLAIAFFLLWLIVDLFLLRALAFSESCGLGLLRADAPRRGLL